MSRRSDVLIIGAGSAGCVIANRLSADPSRTVTVVEAGGNVTDPEMRRPELWPFIHGRSYDWAYHTVPQPGLNGRSLEWARGKGLGGSSLIHAMAHMRGCRADFERWVTATGDSRWSWDALVPYFAELETYSEGKSEVHGDSGPLPVLLPGPELSSPLVRDYIAAWQALGATRIPGHNDGEMLGVTPNSVTISDGQRATVADGYLTPVLSRPNLTVRTESVVHRLVLEGTRVVAALVTSNGTTELVEADTVILAAGSIGDPLLLMRSGVGDPAVLAEAGVECLVSAVGIGENLHDHLLGAGNLYSSRQIVPPTKLQLSESMAYFSADGPEITEGAADIVVGCVVGPSASEQFASVYETLEPGLAYTLLFGVTNPTSRGSLRITGPDVSDEPLIDPNYLSTEHDRAMLRAAFRAARRVGHSEGMSQWRNEEVLPGPIGETDADLDEFIAAAVITHHHPVGTLSMGATDSSPVTSDLRLRALDNVFVVDASVIPSITAGPVHAAVLAIAESFSAGYR